MDDTAPLGEPLHGRGHGRVTFPGHTRPPNEVKETGIIQAKQPKHAKAKNENKITQAEFCVEDTKVIIQNPRVVARVQTIQRITSLSKKVKTSIKEWADDRGWRLNRLFPEARPFHQQCGEWNRSLKCRSPGSCRLLGPELPGRSPGSCRLLGPELPGIPPRKCPPCPG